MSETVTPNPLLEKWYTPFETPPFDRIRPEHFRPAFASAIEAHRAQIDAIAGNAEPPTFRNTIKALELSGRPLRQAASVFYNLTGSHTNDAIQAIEREIAPVMARHRNDTFLNEKLFARIRAVWDKRATLDLSPEELRVVDRYHTRFVRNGAHLEPEAKKRLAAIDQRLATLGTQFSQNVLADEKSWRLVLEGEDDLAGLPDFARAAAAEAAEERSLPGKYAITLSRSSIEPFLQFSTRRDLRETAWRAWLARGAHDGATDNRPIAAEMVSLRTERARLLGYNSYAEYRLDDTMAKTPEAAVDLLRSVWQPAVRKAAQERRALQEIVRAEGGNFRLAAWDWRHFAEQRRQAEFDLGEAEIKPYFQLEKMIEAAFETAHRLFGLVFIPRDDVPVYHCDVRVWEVTGAEERHIGLFLGDYFARASKRSGAWMSGFRPQEKLFADIRPIVVNVMNFSKASGGEPALLSFDDARTLFHEFGHALHALLSDVTYPLLSGTSVGADFVELPSQLFEHWLERPEILRRYAVHYRTGEPMPDDLVNRLLKSVKFNQGFASVEYLASALVDLDLHAETSAQVDITEFERKTLKQIGMPQAIAMRHRLPHFQHLFSGDGYAAGYYSYLWAEVLAADAFDAFEEAGDIFDAGVATRLRENILSAGYLREPDEAYRRFRGRAAAPEPLMRRRGLLEAPVEGA